MIFLFPRTDGVAETHQENFDRYFETYRTSFWLARRWFIRCHLGLWPEFLSACLCALPHVFRDYSIASNISNFRPNWLVQISVLLLSADLSFRLWILDVRWSSDAPGSITEHWKSLCHTPTRFSIFLNYSDILQLAFTLPGGSSSRSRIPSTTNPWLCTASADTCLPFMDNEGNATLSFLPFIHSSIGFRRSWSRWCSSMFLQQSAMWRIKTITIGTTVSSVNHWSRRIPMYFALKFFDAQPSNTSCSLWRQRSSQWTRSGSNSARMFTGKMECHSRVTMKA